MIFVQAFSSKLSLYHHRKNAKPSHLTSGDWADVFHERSHALPKFHRVILWFEMRRPKQKLWCSLK